MDSVMSIAASGMRAATMLATASASNLANMGSNGPVPATPPSQPVPQSPRNVYQPVTVSQAPAAGGGVAASVAPALPSYTFAYNPSAPYANLQGMVAVPNVDPATEIVNQISASLSFRANAYSFRAAASSFKTLLDATA